MKLKIARYVCVLVLTLIWYQPAQASPPERNLQLSLKDLGHNNLSLSGMYGADSAWIPFQSNWVLEQPVKVNVAYVASPLLNVEQSTLTVLANDLAVTSIHPIADGTEQHFSFLIPTDRLQGQGVALRFQGFLRLTDLPCESTNNPGQWLTILDKTSVSLAPVPDSFSPDLANLTQAIVVQNALDAPPPVLFVLPESPSSTAMTTAAQVAARLGRSAGSNPFPLQVETAQSLTEAQKQQANLVVVGLPKNNPLLGQMAKALPASLVPNGYVTADKFVAPPEHGIIQILNSPWNEARNVLVISGGEEDGLQLAGQAFADRPTFQSLHGSFKFVRALETMPESRPGPAWLTPITTLAQLGHGDRTVTGTGIFQEYYFIHRPPGWILDDGTQLTLHLGFSTALQASESYVAVFINEVHVGTARIGHGIEEPEFAFYLPVALLNERPNGERPQAMTLRLEIASFLAESSCVQTHQDAAWTKIFADSYFVTPHAYMALPDLQAFPYPFVSDQPEAPVVIVLPPKPDRAELELALSLASTVGRFAPTDFDLQLLPADLLSKKLQREANLIILGTRSRQPLIDEFLNTMDTTPYFRDEQGLYQALKNSDTGLLRESPSPWNAQRVTLLAFSETTSGFEKAVKSLLDSVPPVTQPGSVAVVEADQPPRIIHRSVEAEPGPVHQLVLREPLIPSPQPWVIITLVLILTTVAVLGTIWYSRRWSAGQRTQ